MYIEGSSVIEKVPVPLRGLGLWYEHATMVSSYRRKGSFIEKLQAYDISGGGN